MNGEEQMIENTHAGEKRGGLECPGHTEMGAFVHRQAGDVSAHEIDMAGIG